MALLPNHHVLVALAAAIALSTTGLVGLPGVLADAPGTTVAEGHIALGSPTTLIRSVAVATGVNGVDSFLFHDPPARAWLTTVTTDNAGIGYDLDIYFHDADGGYLGGCASLAPDEVCQVPEGAARGSVDAYRGADLDVRLEVADTPVGETVTAEYLVLPFFMCSPKCYAPASLGGARLPPMATPPKDVLVKDAGGGPVAITACQDTDGDNVCGEIGEPRVEACGDRADLRQALVEFASDRELWVFVDQDVIGCAAVAVAGVIEVHYGGASAQSGPSGTA